MKNLVNSRFIVKPIGLTIAIICAANTGASASSTLEELVITSQFRDTRVLDLANSVSVFGQQDVKARGASNIEPLLNMAPNVNFSAGASRGRLVQIRGVGERSQFIDPVNPSVGLIIDGIDFTGLGERDNVSADVRFISQQDQKIVNGMNSRDYTRGFYFSNAFGNNPANDYAPEAYYQFGEARVSGVSGSYRF